MSTIDERWNIVDTTRAFCQKVLPLVYDESLSYMELVCKLSSKLNEVIENNNNLPQYVKELIKETVNSDEFTQIVGSVLMNTIINVKFPPEGIAPAKGDGVTDDTSSIQACFDYANNQGGAVVFFPSGKYLTGTLSINTETSILGADRYNTSLVLKGGGNTPLLQGAINQSVRNICLDGNRLNQVEENYLVDGTIEMALFDNVILTDSAHCIHSNSFNNNQLTNVYSNNITDGYFINGSGNENYILLRTNDKILLQGTDNFILPNTPLLTNVKDYGAKGDGITNDTEAIQLALNNTNAIFIPAGIYLVDTIEFKTNSVIIGENDDSVTLISNNNIVLKSDKWNLFDSGATNGTNGFIISNIEINGNNKTANIGIAIYGDHYKLNQVIVNNCKIGIKSGWNTNLGASDDNKLMEALIEKIRVHDCDTGVEFYGPHDTIFSNSFIYLNNLGMNFLKTQNSIYNGTILSNVHVYACETYGVKCEGDIYAPNLISESCSTALSVNGENSIINGAFFANTDYAIELNGKNNRFTGSVSGNKIFNIINDDGGNSVDCFAPTNINLNVRPETKASTTNYKVCCPNTIVNYPATESILRQLITQVGEENKFTNTYHSPIFITTNAYDNMYMKFSDTMSQITSYSFILNPGDSFWITEGAIPTTTGFVMK